MFGNLKKYSPETVIFLLVFVFFIGILGIGSYIKLLYSYVNKIPANNQISSDAKTKFESDYETYFIGKYTFLDLNGGARRLLKQREMNKIVKLDNGYLHDPVIYTTDEELEKYAASVVRLRDYLASKDIKLVYFSTPYLPNEDLLPAGVRDYGASNVDRFEKLLNASGIDTLNFDKMLADEGLSYYDHVYRTDHHWTTMAGFRAYNGLESYLTKVIDCDVDERIGNIDNYVISSYKEAHLGSYGMRTGKLFARPDDFELILPDFDTCITASNGETGSVNAIMFNPEALSNRDFAKRDTYGEVLSGGFMNYVNQTTPNDKKILMVSDSMIKAMMPYLAMAFSEVRYVYDKYGQELTKDIIDEYDPDIVVLMYGPVFLQEGSHAFDYPEY
ncbi:MAG: hypothetical protein K5886_07805 [Lachnospiraceae bacterium]|nr:hypothetical protein [Lachnospiraceae bacterium]